MDERVNIVVDSATAKRGIDVLVDSVQRMKRSFEQAETSTDKFFTNLTTGLDRAQSAFMSFRNVVASMASTITIFKQLGDHISKFQAFISAMSVSVGGVRQARSEYSFLMDMSNRLGVSVNSLSHNYSQLAAATNGTAITTNRLRNIFESFSIAARVMHLSTIDTRLMFYALTQMVSKGSVSMEELRRQLGEKLPGAMKIAANSVNATADQLEAAIRKGIVDPTKFLPIFADAVRTTFSPGLALAMQAFDAELNRMTNSVQALIVQMYDLGVADSFTKVIKEINRLLSDPTIGDALARAVKSVADEATRFLRSISAQDIDTFFQTFSGGVRTLAGAIGNALPYMKTMAEYTGIIIGGMVVLKGAALGAAAGQAIAPGPIGGVGGAVVGGGAALTGVLATRNALKNIGTAEGSYSRPITGMARAREIEAAKNENLNSYMFGGAKSTYQLSDVLKESDKNKVSPMDTFIQGLNERGLGTGGEGNRYEALRSKANYLAKANPGRLQEALKMIEQMEARGDEFEPIIRSIGALVDVQNRTTPDAIDRRIEEMIKKYPNAPGKADEVRKLGAQYRTQYQDKLTREQDAFDSKQTEIIRRLEVEKSLYEEQYELIGKGADEKERILKRLDMEKRLEEQIAVLRKEALTERRQFDESGFRGRGKESIDSAVGELKRLQDARKTADAGWKQSMQDYADSVADMATQISQTVGKAFKGMEDAIVEFVKTGKLSFRSLAESIIEDMIRIQVRQAITGPLAKAMGGWNLFGGGADTAGMASMVAAGVFHTGGIVGAAGTSRLMSIDAFAGAKKYHTGGLVSGEQPIIAKRGEGVFTPEQMKALAPTNGGSTGNVNISIQVDAASGSQSVSSSNVDDQSLKELAKTLGARVRDEIVKQKRPGGLLAQN